MNINIDIPWNNVLDQINHPSYIYIILDFSFFNKELYTNLLLHNYAAIYR